MKCHLYSFLDYNNALGNDFDQIDEQKLVRKDISIAYIATKLHTVAIPYI